MAPKKVAPTTALANWDEELAQQAAVAAGMEANAGGGKFFSTKGGILAWDGAPMKNNEMAVYLIDSILTNVFYQGAYDADNPQSPVCFALSRVDGELKPHASVVKAEQAVHEACNGCPNNVFGSADTGKGKACKNGRRLAVIPAGIFGTNGKLERLTEEQITSAPIGYLNVPVMSIKGYANFVLNVSSTLNRPPHGVIARVKIVPDPKSQFKMIFDPIEKTPNELMGAVMARHKEALKTTDFPFALGSDEEPTPTKGKKQDRSPPGKKAPKKPVKKY